jgi:hypothetical protein
MRFFRSCATAVAGFALSCAQAQQHPFTVKDDIAMNRISEPRADPATPGSEIAWPSPDGRFVAIITTRGILNKDQIESRILTFDLQKVSGFLADQLRSAPEPRVIASVQSYPHHLETEAYAPVIKDIRWAEDSTSVYFRAENIGGNYQLCNAKIRTKAVQSLTPKDKSVDHFDVTQKTIAFNAADAGRHLIDPGEVINQDAVNLTGARLQEVLFPDDIASRASELFHIYTVAINERRPRPRIVPSYSLLNIPYLSGFYPFKLSPNAKEIIQLEPTRSVPETWAHYIPAPGRDHLRLVAAKDPRLLRADNILRPLEYTLIDLKTGKKTSLLRAPNARSLGYPADRNRIAWSADGRQVIVTNTFLPTSSDTSSSEAEYPCAAAVIDLTSLRHHCLYFEEAGTAAPEALHIQDVSYGNGPDEILILLRGRSGQQMIRRYVLCARVWQLERSFPPPSPLQTLSRLTQVQHQTQKVVRVFVRQTLNDPPAIWASDASGRQRKLWDPNPQFQQMQFGDASLYHWKDRTSDDWSGILLKPVDYVVGKRYPLILQMYNYVDDAFVTDGLYPTAFAARHLADAGFVVLQIRKKPDTLSEQDPQHHLDGYRSAIASLSELGIVDRTKVGVVGFSWTCWYVINALIKEPALFAGATIADGLDNSYMQYMLFTVEYYPLQNQMEKIRGGRPIGNSLQSWVDVAPGFHLDRVQTPVRIEAIGPPSVLQEWELYASLRLQKKPVDLIYFPEGTHIHQRPLERLESQQGNVDWFRFWLKGEKDPDPAKRNQYLRWEGLRENSAPLHRSSSFYQSH